MVGSGGFMLDALRLGTNCHGFTFDRGGSQVEGADVDKVLRDNFTPIAARQCKEAARVCDVIVWRPTPGGEPDHSGVVVAVDAGDKPLMVVSKFGATGGLFAHPPDAWAVDWEIHRRKAPPATPEVQDLQRQAEQAKQDLAAKTITPEQFYRKVADLCQAMNALTRTAER
jgi:hypothetical protein